MGLLKTVFEVNLGLFGKKTPDGYVFDYSCVACTHAYPLEQPEPAYITALRHP